jgi:tRNA threonylcarbamoyladenosine biosynthesis protein TsaE
MEIVSKSLEETGLAAQNFLNTLGSSEGTLLIALSGDLGAGKTAFVQACASILGVKSSITSPTFVIMKKYSLVGQNFKQLVHIDAYRLKNGDELNKLRFQELFNEKGNIIFLEWPENVSDALPEVKFELRFFFVDQNTRKIELP